MAGLNYPHAPVGTCEECGKQCFPTRKAARGYMKRKRTDGEALSVYRCGEYFHFGHTPYMVARGAQQRRSS